MSQYRSDCANYGGGGIEKEEREGVRSIWMEVWEPFPEGNLD